MTYPAPILLAEDDDEDAQLMEHAFQSAGVSNPLFRVRNGEEAINYLAGNGIYSDRNAYPFPVLLLLDLRMPKCNGFEVLAWIETQTGMKRPNITVLSSSDESADVAKAYELGAHSYLQKPAEFIDLVQLLRSIGSYWLIVEKPECAAELP
jgi:CheY-like chemotaxis protein